MSTLSVGTIQSNTTSPPTINNSAGTQIGTFCRAWVNFNGTGVIAIRAQFNVTSITDNGNGNYTVNWTAGALTDANYAIGGIPSGGTDRFITVQTLVNYTTSACQIVVRGGGGGANDVDMVSIIAFR